MAAQYCVDSQKWMEKARLLLSDGAVPVFPATLKEAMTHHTLPKQKKDDRQDSYKQELPNRRVSTTLRHMILEFTEV
jgi:hypothetical protein